MLNFLLFYSLILRLHALTKMSVQKLMSDAVATVIRGGPANPPNKDFTKTNNHQVSRGGADCYN